MRTLTKIALALVPLVALACAGPDEESSSASSAAQENGAWKGKECPQVGKGPKTGGLEYWSTSSGDHVHGNGLGATDLEACENAAASLKKCGFDLASGSVQAYTGICLVQSCESVGSGSSRASIEVKSKVPNVGSAKGLGRGETPKQACANARTSLTQCGYDVKAIAERLGPCEELSSR